MKSAYAIPADTVPGPLSEPPVPLDPREGVRRALAFSAGAEAPETISDEDLDEFLAQKGEKCPDRCVLFDVRFYLSQLPPRIGVCVNPVLHYLEVGAPTGLLPHPVFDPGYVGRQMGTQDVPVVDGSGWLAVLASRGAPLLSPHPLFDPDVYLRATGREGKPLSENPILTFIRGWPEERAAFSPYFDCDFYLRQVPHLRTGLMDPLSHYLLQPDALRLDPNPMVHGKYYQNRYPDVGEDALSHYVQFGVVGGRAPNPYAPRELGELGMTPSELRDYIRVWSAT